MDTARFPPPKSPALFPQQIPPTPAPFWGPEFPHPPHPTGHRPPPPPSHPPPPPPNPRPFPPNKSPHPRPLLGFKIHDTPPIARGMGPSPMLPTRRISDNHIHPPRSSDIDNRQRIPLITIINLHPPIRIRIHR